MSMSLDDDLDLHATGSASVGTRPPGRGRAAALLAEGLRADFPIFKQTQHGHPLVSLDLTTAREIQQPWKRAPSFLGRELEEHVGHGQRAHDGHTV